MLSSFVLLAAVTCSQTPAPAANASLEALAQLQKTGAQIEFTIKIDDRKFGDKELKELIPQLQSLGGVRDLDVSKTSITPKGALVLKELKGMKSLKTVNVPDPVLNAPESQEISGALGIPVIGEWRFVGKRITPGMFTPEPPKK
jgi:hypothetical protein